MVILLGWNLKFSWCRCLPEGLFVQSWCCLFLQPSTKNLQKNQRPVVEKPVVFYRKWKLNISFGDVLFGCLVNQPITTKVIDSHESCFCLKNLSQLSDSRFVDSIRARFNKNKLLWPRGSVTNRSEDIQKFGTEKWHSNQGTKIQQLEKTNFIIPISRLFCPIGIHVCNIYLNFSWFLYGICR